MHGIDLSFSSLDVSALAGIDIVVQDLWTGGGQPPPRVENLRAALAAGKRIAGYMAVNPSLPDNVSMARAGVPDDIWAALAFVAVDCELYTTLMPAKVRAESDALAALLPGRLRVIYTGEGYWRGTMGNDASFGDHWLWDARPGSALLAGYGAWPDKSRLVGVQTTDSTSLGSMMVDYDIFSTEVLNMTTQPAQDPPAKAAARRQLIGAVLIDDMGRLVADLVLFGVLATGTTAARTEL